MVTGTCMGIYNIYMNALRKYTLQQYCFQKRKEDKLRLILQVKN